MITTEKSIFNGSLLLNIALGVIICFLLLRQCGHGVQLNTDVTETVTTQKYSDTIYIPKKDTVWLSRLLPAEPVEIKPFAGVVASDTGTAIDNSTCMDTAVYKVPFSEPNNYSLVLHEKVSGNRTIYRKLDFADLRPDKIIHDSVVVTIEKTITPKEKVRLYIGASFEGGYGRALNPNANMLRFGGGPDVMLTVPKGAAIAYSYDVWNNTHRAGFLFKIKLKR